MSSSGFVPMPFSNRVAKEYCVLFKDAALAGKRALALLEISLPNCGCGAFHGVYNLRSGDSGGGSGLRIEH